MNAALTQRGCAVLLAWSQSACSGAPAPVNYSFPAQPLALLTSDSLQQRVAVRTAPQQPPARGVVGMQLTITDAATDEPQAGLELKVVPWMPAMGHGTSVTPTVTETAPGIYTLENLVLFMPGTWQIRAEWNEPPLAHVTPVLDVR